jgi:GT2 family glycosyltransferase
MPPAPEPDKNAIKVDVVIPTCKPMGPLAGLLAEVRSTITGRGNVYATCQPVSASKNRNIGLDKASTEFIIMIDDDVHRFPPGWDQTLIQPLIDDPLCMMVSPRLLNPDGSLGQMLGHPPALDNGELWEVPRQELPTACIAIRKNDLRFDEDFIGSGWEDTAYCAALRARHPQGKFVVHGGVRIIHVNEQKNQGVNFDHNRAIYVSKWGEPR